jgi:ABC-type polysaccharide/polyol phosphate transport system ATPase subunit
MSDVVIQVEGIGKKYLINHNKQSDQSLLRDVLSDRAKKIFNPKRWKNLRGDKEEFWALKDINFEIKKGEKIGIIGKNGSGKSTLLKILSRITAPTEGRVEMHGRVSSLLEVGTGFHPELTGRENIFLNGTILGMSYRDVNKQLDEIIDFSGVEKFIDTPVKRYSSGMKTRLGFAIAAHLQNDILILDEVLAVGDAEFQKKCLGTISKMSAAHGKTIIFVSHDMAAMRSLCQQGILLENGRNIKTGNMEDIVSHYLFQLANSETDMNHYSVAHLEGLGLEVASIFPMCHTYQLGSDLALTVVVKMQRHFEELLFAVSFVNTNNRIVATGISNIMSFKSGLQETVTFTIHIPNFNLAPGHYSLNVAIGQGRDLSSFRPLAMLKKVGLFDVQTTSGHDNSVPAWKSEWGSTVIVGIASECQEETI